MKNSSNIIHLLKHIWSIIEFWPFIKEHWFISFVILFFIVMSLGHTENKKLETGEDKSPIEKKDSMEKKYNPIEINKKVIYFFRFILVASILTAIISVVLDIFLIDTLPHSLQRYLSSQSQNMGSINNKEAALVMLFTINNGRNIFCLNKKYLQY